MLFAIYNTNVDRPDRVKNPVLAVFRRLSGSALAVWLLRPQTFYRRRQGSGDRFVRDRKGRDQEGRADRQHKGPPPDANAVGETLEPAVHGDPGHRRGDDEGQGDQYDEFPAEQEKDIRHRGTQYFPDADFAGPLKGGEGDQPIEAQAANEDGDAGEEAEGQIDLLFLPI